MVLPRDGLKDAAGKPLHYIGSTMSASKTFTFRAMRRAISRPTTRTSTPLRTPWTRCANSSLPMLCSTAGVGALTGKDAMPAKVGETVLIVHSQVDRDLRPHLVGGHGDYVGRPANSQILQ